MDGRPLVRFLYVEEAKGGKPLVTDQDGNVFEGEFQDFKLPEGLEGQLLFALSSGGYKPDHLLMLTRSARNDKELAALKAADKTPILYGSYLYVWDTQYNQWVPEANPSKIIGVGRFIYDYSQKRLYYTHPDNGLTLISSGGDAVSTITCKASEAIEKCQLCVMAEDGTVKPADKVSGKAVGYALETVPAGQEVDIQVGGVYQDFSRLNLIPGKVYYQGDKGEIELIDKPVTFKHPAGLATGLHSLIILTEIYMGEGGAGGGSTTITGISVVRKEKELRGESNDLSKELLSLKNVMVEIFERPDWDSQPYMLKQILTIENTDTTAILQFSIKDKNNPAVEDSLPKKEIVTIPVKSTDWVLKVKGKYKVSLVVEVISGLLGLKTVNDSTQIPPGAQYQMYTDPNDNTLKYLIFGAVKKFEVVSSSDILFDYPKWISDTIGSQDYMVIGSLRLLAKGTEPKSVKVLQGDKELYTFNLVPGVATVVDLHREDVKFIATEPGSVEATANLQATAYVFK